MRFKLGFLLITLLIFTFTLTVVSAGENTTEITSDGNDTVDLVVSLNIVDYMGEHKEKYVVDGSNVTWRVNVTSIGGTAYNTTVYSSLPTGLKYLSHNPNESDFNPKTGIWIVGTLKENETASLTVITFANKTIFGNVELYRVEHIAHATTTSTETYLENNMASAEIYFPIATSSVSMAEAPEEHEFTLILTETEEYSDYREVTKKVDNRKVNAKTANENAPEQNDNNKNKIDKSKIDKKEIRKTGSKGNSIRLNEITASNPIAIALLSLLILASARFKRR